MVSVTVTAPVEPETEIPEPAASDVTPELVMLGAEPPTTVNEVQLTPLEQVALEVATCPKSAGVPEFEVQ